MYIMLLGDVILHVYVQLSVMCLCMGVLLYASLYLIVYNIYKTDICGKTYSYVILQGEACLSSWHI